MNKININLYVGNKINKLTIISDAGILNQRSPIKCLNDFLSWINNLRSNSIWITNV